MEIRNYTLITNTQFAGEEYGLYESDIYGEDEPYCVANITTHDIIGYTYDTLIDFLNDKYC